MPRESEPALQQVEATAWEYVETLQRDLHACRAREATLVAAVDAVLADEDPEEDYLPGLLVMAFDPVCSIPDGASGPDRLFRALRAIVESVRARGGEGAR